MNFQPPVLLSPTRTQWGQRQHEEDLLDDDYDVISQSQQKGVEAAAANPEPSTTKHASNKFKQNKGAKTCTLEKTMPWNVTPSGLDIDWTTKLVV